MRCDEMRMMRAEPRRAEENQFEKLKPTILGCLESGIARKEGSKCGEWEWCSWRAKGSREMKVDRG